MNPFARELANKKYEVTETGIFLPASKIKMGGVFTHDVNGLDVQHDGNIVVDEGLTHVLDVALSNATQTATWYLTAFKNNYTPVAGDTAALFFGAGVASELVATTDVDEAVRETWVEAGVAAKAITNAASPAQYTAAAGLTLYGAAVVSTNTIGGTGGVLLAAAKFATSRVLVTTDVLNITYSFTIADA